MRVIHGDCLAVLRAMPDNSIDAVVTDPPYGLGFMGQKWDTYANETGRAPSSKRHKFDHVGGNHNPSNSADAARTRRVEAQRFGEWCDGWTAECLRVLKPGGHMLAFGSSRTWHRLAVSVEDAGFEIRDTITWLYGSGFPKSLDVSKAIDKARRRDYVLAAVALGLTIPGNNLHDWTKAEHSPGDAWWERFKAHLAPEQWAAIERAVVGQGKSGATAGMQQLGPSGIKGGDYDLTTPATDAARQWQGWGTALKPASEPIIVARKPLTGTVAATVLAHGTGALNVDACRVAHASEADRAESEGKNQHARYGTAPGQNNVYGDYSQTPTKDYTAPSGRWPANVVLTHGADCADVCVEGCPVAELDAQSGTLAFGGANRSRAARDGTGVYGATERTEPAPYVTDSGGASRFFPTFRYQAKAPTKERPKVDGVAHPTVKPLALMRWLVRLVCPPGGTVLDPFAGSGTTGEAAVMEGFNAVLIERDPTYLPLIEQRRARRQADTSGDQLTLVGG